MELIEAIKKRRSIREFSEKEIEEDKINKLVLAGCEVSSDKGFRVVPSAGALYPLRFYVWKNGKLWAWGPIVIAFPCLTIKKIEDIFLNSKFAICIFACFDVTAEKYGERGKRYVYIEVGHAAQNIQLVATELGLGSYCVGAFESFSTIASCTVVPLKAEIHELCYIIPVGYPKEK